MGETFRSLTTLFPVYSRTSPCAVPRDYTRVYQPMLEFLCDLTLHHRRLKMPRRATSLKSIDSNHGEVAEWPNAAVLLNRCTG